MAKFINYTDRLGGNTIINYEGGQSFGFWPWRIVRPVVYGTAVDWHGLALRCTTKCWLLWPN